MYGWSLSDTWIERQPRTAPSSWWLKNCSRCRSCRSHAIEPCSPFISSVKSALWPRAKRVASKVASEPLAKRARKRLASSAVTACSLSAQRMHALADEDLRRAGHFRNRPDEPERRIDAMGEQVARDAAPRNAGVEPPCARPALRQFGRHGPVLQELEAAVEDAPEPAVFDHLPCEGSAGTRR